MHSYLTLLLITTLTLVILAVIVWRKQNVPGAHAFSCLLISLAVWSFGYFFEIRSPEFSEYFFWANFEYLGIVLIPVTWITFVAKFTGQDHLVTRRNVLLLSIEPLIIILLVWSNPIHSLIWKDVDFVTHIPLRFAIYTYGNAFWINAFYTYLLLLIGSVLLFRYLMKYKRVFRSQLAALLVGLLAPWILNFLYLLNINPLPHFELMFLGLTITGVAISLALIRYRFLDILPVAHTSLIKYMTDGLIVLDEKNRIVEMNPTAINLFNKPLEKMLALPVCSALSDYEEFIATIQDINDGKAEVKIKDKQSHQHVYELSITPLNSEAQSYSGKMVVLRDISDRLETIEFLKRREAILVAIRFAASEFMKGKPWEEIIPEILEELGKVVQASRTYLFQNHRNSHGVLLTSKRFEWTAPGIQSQLKNPKLKDFPVFKAGFARWHEMMSQGEPVFGIVSEFPSEEQGFLQQLGILSLVVVPICVGETFWGFIGFDDCLTMRIWTNSEIDALKAAASTLGSSIQRQEMESQLRDRITILDDLYQTSLEISAPHDLPVLLRTIVARAVELLDATGGALFLSDPEREEVSCMVSYQTRSDYTGMVLKFGEGAAGIAAQTGNPLIIPDYRSWPDRSPTIQPDHPFRSVLSVPMTWQNRVLGVILVLHDIKPNQFSEKDLTMLSLFANQAGVAIENARLYSIQKQRARELGILYESSTTIIKSLDLSTVCQNSAEQLSRAVNSTSAFILTCELESGMTKIQAEYFSPEANPQERVSEIDSTYDLFNYPKSIEFLRQGKPQVIRPDDPEIDPYNRKELLAHGIKSALEVPMIVSGRVLGFADIWESREFRVWSEEEIQFCQTLSNQAAIAIDNARLYQEILQLSVTDMLTGIYNRRGLCEIGQRELQRAHRSNRPLTAIMLDIDHFKEINDIYSHSVGDQVLTQLVKICQTNLREIDIMGRYGGEEFIILLPDAEWNAAYQVAERLRMSIENTSIMTEAGAISITVSIGIACTINSMDELSTLLDQADSAMYSAKQRGRNRIGIDDRSLALPAGRTL